MASQSVTISLPEPLYERLRERAEQTQRSVEEETLEALATAVPVNGSLPHEISAAVESLDQLDDTALWDAARGRLPESVSSELESLHMKERQVGLTAEESQRLVQLVQQYEQHMLVRARATVLLKQRGHDISGLLVS